MRGAVCADACVHDDDANGTVTKTAVVITTSRAAKTEESERGTEVTLGARGEWVNEGTQRLGGKEGMNKIQIKFENTNHFLNLI